jgi:prevent-host-death family protein
MKTVELEEATAPLAEYTEDLSSEPVILTRHGTPVAALLSLEHIDLESLRVSTSPVFWEIIEQSRAEMAAKGGITTEEMRERLGLKPKG